MSRAGGDKVTGPLEAELTSWQLVAERARAKLVQDRISLAAASLAYHGFLAVFPAVIAMLGLVTLLHLGPHQLARLTHDIDRALPSGASAVFTAAVDAGNKRTSGPVVALILGTLTAIWSANSGMAALQQALDIAYEVPVDRKFVSRRLHGLPLLLATVVLGGTGAALVIFGPSLTSSVESHSPVHGLAFSLAWGAARWAVTILVVSTLFSIYYYAGPNHPQPRWQWVTAGGLLATAIFLLASLGFSFYVNAFGAYGRTYGSFAGAAILIFWLYLTGVAVLVGGEFNAEVGRQADARSAGWDETIGAEVPETPRPEGPDL